MLHHLQTVDSVSGSQHKGTSYLYGISANAPDYLKQTFSMVLFNNIIIKSKDLNLSKLKRKSLHKYFTVPLHFMSIFDYVFKVVSIS